MSVPVDEIYGIAAGVHSGGRVGAQPALQIRRVDQAVGAYRENWGRLAVVKLLSQGQRRVDAVLTEELKESVFPGRAGVGCNYN